MNLDEVARLIAEVREDDERMSKAPWSAHSHDSMSPITLVIDGTSILVPYANERDAIGIARTRNNLRAMADQLEAAQAEIARLGHAFVCEERLAAEGATAITKLTAERDKLQAELKAARQEAEHWSRRTAMALSKSCPVQSNECAIRSRCTNKCGQFDVELDRAHAYRAARDKAGG